MKRFVQILRVSFFISISPLLWIHCRHAEDRNSISIVSKNGKAVSVIIRGAGVNEEEISTRLKLQLIKPGERVPVLGDFRKEGDEVIFEPLVPFTKGLRYEVLLDDTVLSEIEIPMGDSKSPELLAIYPSQDTLPENLLKIYFEFSEPMVEGSSLTHLTLIANDRDTLRGTFLNLQPELWNADGTVLTLWLDPGRIKRDLIPNKELGSPLNKGERYTLHLSKSWQSKSGMSLTKNYAKSFVTTKRDEESPDPKTWKVLAPNSKSKQALEIQFPQPLDYFLVKECITILNSDDEIVFGTVAIVDKERLIRFVPNEPWKKGTFVLNIESRLEDLAGNNLNRPFEQHVDEKNEGKEQKIFAKEFEILQ
jgi:hypothetical protein